MARDKVKQAELRAQGLHVLGSDIGLYSLSCEESLGKNPAYFFHAYVEWMWMCWHVCGCMNVCRWACTWHVEVKG